MRQNPTGTQAIIAGSYERHYNNVLRYISGKINDVAEAENLTQDVWVRLMTCGKQLSPDMLTSFIYTIAHNLVNDYLRKLYTRRQYKADMENGRREEIDDTAESAFYARNLAAFEMKRVECLSRQRRNIYKMSRFEDKSVSDIARQLYLSTRTVENHLRISRREVREYMASLA
ncbi:MAG: sigma-70 family RNA polymerase sigma factor [Muribaculaceae bacterium]|nr:sigma-70 family RNA polymerase sigma factor [Muribaculaceae bacterium]